MIVEILMVNSLYPRTSKEIYEGGVWPFSSLLALFQKCTAVRMAQV